MPVSPTTGNTREQTEPLSNMTSTYINPSASTWSHSAKTDYAAVQNFHHKLPGYQPSPLIPLPELAKELSVRSVFIKDESNRLGLPAYKILGASWGTFRSIAKVTDLPLDSSLDDLAKAAQKLDIRLFAATEGNHGRAVARMANILGIKATIYVAGFTDQPVKENIASEGASVITVEGIYDDAVAVANAEVQKTPNALLIQDVALEGYEELPNWIIDGYSTLPNEVEQQLTEQNIKPTIMVAPIGAGSLGHAVVCFCKSEGRNIRVVTVEPETAACLNHNLRQGKHETIKTTKTIMDGMNCGTVSPISWPILQQGVDASVVVTDKQCHQAIQDLEQQGVNSGPCGAGSLAAIRKLAAEQPLDADSVVVLLSTEGRRYYKVPG